MNFWYSITSDATSIIKMNRKGKREIGINGRGNDEKDFEEREEKEVLH